MTEADPTCPHCGGVMPAGGTAIGCGRGWAVEIPLPAACNSPRCRADRSDRAIADAIAKGVIDP